jgi:hypothetical protein
MRMPIVSSTRSPGCFGASVLVLIAVGGGGCASTRATRKPSVAVAVVETMGVEARQGADLQRAVRREIVRHEGVRAAAGEQDSADLELSMTLAGLGEVRLVRTRLVRRKDGMVLKDLQETVRHEPRGLERYARDLTGRLFPRRAPTPWYRRWWIWAAAAGVVGGTVGVVFATTREPETDPNVVRLGDL